VSQFVSKPILRFALVATLAAMTGVGVAVGFQGSGRKSKTRIVKRVAKPTFEAGEWDDVFFDNLFRDGLVGERPAQPTDAELAAKGQVGRDSNAGDRFRWSGVVSAPTLEDEVKSMLQRLGRDVTTPLKFSTEFNKVRESFEMLSVLFAVIREFDGRVRWQKDAANAQFSFETAAANARVGSRQAFESCLRRHGDLIQMVRGDSFPSSGNSPGPLDWSTVIGHSPVMERLEVELDLLKQMSSNEIEFKTTAAKILHSAELIALLGTSVQQEGMEYAGDDEYLVFAKQMTSAAKDIAKACRNSNHGLVAEAVNRVSQSCIDCHGVFR